LSRALPAVPRETHQAKVARTRELIASLARTYPEAHCELNHSNPLELLVATILSAQCTDKQVNLVTADLFKKYRTVGDYARAPLEELGNDIRRLGFFRNKARSIQGCCRTLQERHAGEVPRTMDELVQLDGVGRKTANVVLGNAFGINAGLVVDTHVGRLAGRLGLSTAKDPVKIEQDLIRLVPQDQWTLFSHWLIWHGRRRCFARKPQCEACEIRGLCPRRGVSVEPQRKAAANSGVTKLKTTARG
jgi:endonuclease III